MKTICKVLLIVALIVALWALFSPEKAGKASNLQPISYSLDSSYIPDGRSRIPIEVIEKGSAPKMVYVQSMTDAVPEPGSFSLFAFSALMLALFRRRP